MKYRIKVVNTLSSTKYYPQYRNFGIWLDFYGLNGCCIFTFNKKDAQYVIDRDKSVDVSYLDA